MGNLPKRGHFGPPRGVPPWDPILTKRGVKNDHFLVILGPPVLVILGKSGGFDPPYFSANLAKRGVTNMTKTWSFLTQILCQFFCHFCAILACQLFCQFPLFRGNPQNSFLPISRGGYPPGKMLAGHVTMAAGGFLSGPEGPRYKKLRRGMVRVIIKRGVVCGVV